MARLTSDQITKEVESKGFTVVDSTQYKNLRTPILIRCGQNHTMKASIYEIRKDSFRCPTCYGGDVQISNYSLEKKGFRTVALDNSTQRVGLAIFDGTELVYYKLLNFSGPDFEERLLNISNYIEDVIIEEWDPDLIVYEDVQFQSNYNTYKKLSMLLGILLINSMKYGIEAQVVSVNTWRNHYQIGRDRKDAKKKAISLVKTMYDITVNDDVAEAILLGKYIAEKENIERSIKKAF